MGQQRPVATQTIRVEDAAYAVALAGLGQCDLAVDQHVGPALDRRDDHVNALRRTLKGVEVPQIALDNLSAAFQKWSQNATSCRLAGAPDEQSDASVRCGDEVVSDAAAEHTRDTDEKNRLSHCANSLIKSRITVVVPIACR